MAAATGFLLLAAMAACGQTDAQPDADASSSPSPTDTSKTPVPSPSSSSASPSATAEPTASPSEGNAAPTACTSGQLKLSLSQGGGGGAGSQYPYIEFTNTGATCIIEGFPGVSLTSGGRQIGASASWENSAQRKAVTLPQGGVAHAPMRIVGTGNFNAASCQPMQADAIVVYPPEQRESISIPTTQYTGCANASIGVLSVQPVQEGQ